ncbi:MAG: AraC family transcriptional regulator, partial [Acidobacteria bacterium]
MPQGDLHPDDGPGWERSFPWPDPTAARRALQALELETYRAEIDRLVEQVRPLAESAPTLARLVLYEELRALHEAITPATAALNGDLARRRGWMILLADERCPATLLRAFRGEVDRLLAPLSAPSRSVNPIVLRARRFIAEHCHETISLSRVAGELGVARNYLSALFRRETGSTLTEHIHQLRIRHALVLLRAGDRSLSEVAYTVGYQSYRHFYRNFVRIVGQSPTVWLRGLSD